MSKQFSDLCSIFYNQNTENGISSSDSLSERQVLYISGMPGAGKTTLAQRFANRYEATFINEFLEPIPKWVIQTRQEDDLKRKVLAQSWTLNQHVKKNQIIKSMIGKIIVDRTWLDSLIYTLDYGKEAMETLLREVLHHNWVSGLYIALVVRPEVSKTRLMQRLGFSELEWQNDWQVFVERISNATLFLSNELAVETIDNSDLSIEESTKLIKEKFDNYYNNKII